MDDSLLRFWEDLTGRIGGPMSLRLFMQPAVATFLAVRAGLQDAKTGHAPYAWAVFNDPVHRRELLRDGWKSIVKVFLMAIAIDGVYQVRTLGWFYPIEALLVAFLLACVPYLLIRGPVNKIARSWRRSHQPGVR